CDGFVALGGCDKNMPGCAMAMARLNRPAVFVYGGTIRPGAERRDIISVFEAVGAHAAGKLSDAGLLEIERTAIPGPGSCGGMYTANTMASAIEALGLSLPGSSAQEAVGEEKRRDCRRAGEAVVGLVRSGLKPRDILTRQAFENAITVVIALGGSTNAVLHLLAIAHEARVRLDLDDFTRIGRRVPVLADLKPSGRYLMSELIAIGGIQPLMKMLLAAGLLHPDCLTVTGHTLRENLENVPMYMSGQDIVRPLSNPLKKDSHLVVLYGNIAPAGGVGHVSREAPVGGQIALLRHGDRIRIDAARRELHVELPAAELRRRRAAWRPPKPYAQSGVLAKYAQLVGSASRGAVTETIQARRRNS